MPPRTVRVHFSVSPRLCQILPIYSPKPDLPSTKAYDPPEPLASRDLGPPPPGYGRYPDFDRSFTGSSGAAFANAVNGAAPRRNLDEVLCFKCGEKGKTTSYQQM